MTINAQWMVFSGVAIGMFVVGVLTRHHGRRSQDAKKTTAGALDEHPKKKDEAASYAERGV